MSEKDNKPKKEIKKIKNFFERSNYEMKIRPLADKVLVQRLEA